MKVFGLITMLILGFNSGSLAGSMEHLASTVQNNIHTLLHKIYAGYRKFPDITSIQESMNLKYEIWPRYGAPTATDEHVTLNYTDPAGLERSARRGVSTYCDKTDFVNLLPNVLPNLEGTTTLHKYEDFTGNGMRSRNLLFMSFYGNINSHVRKKSATIPEIKEYIRETRIKARTDPKIATRDVLIIGDFNDEKFNLSDEPDMFELTHPALFHQHNSETGKKYIDRIFTNIQSARILEVFPTVENKSNNEEGLLGHKPYLIQIGKTGTESKTVSTIHNKTLKSEGKKWKKSDSMTDDKNLYADTEEGVEKLALEFLQRTKRIFEISTRTRLRTPKSANQCAIDLLNSISDNEINNQKASTTMYGFVELMTGPAETTERSKPTLEEFKKLVEDKLANLKRPNRNKALETARTIWGERNKVEYHFPSRKEFKAIIKHSSRSNARDIHGISPRLLKLLIKASPGAFESFYILSKKIARVGHIPVCWKKDCIFFLYKRKNSRLEAKNYRPITIATGFIKIFCKVMMAKWTVVNDLNFRNHAYTGGKSCLTAVFDVQEAVRDVKKLADELRETESDYEIFPLIFCEDISGAFESIYHDILIEYVDLNFKQTDDFKLDKLTKSYLTREPVITDRETGETINFTKLNDDQTSPQGSSASPPWWRVFDCCITELYMEAARKVAEKCPDIVFFDHFSYSDDKLSILGLRVRKSEEVGITKLKIAKISAIFRELLEKATGSMGCRINPDKSEIVVPAKFEDKNVLEKDKKLKEHFVWLGYSFNLAENRLSFTRRRMNARLENARRDCQKVFQLIKSTAVRRRVFQVYVRPVIDWFVPVVALNKRADHKAMDPLERFQHITMAAVLKSPTSVSRVEMIKTMHETSINTKITLFALRWSYLFKRDLNKFKPNGTSASSSMNLRSGRTVVVEKWPKADKSDFGDMMTTRCEDFKNKDLELPIPREFNARDADEWVTIKKAEIRARINERVNTMWT